ncbi:cell division protein ZipA C-terminal FtsZ-binding domain-containing protein [Ramlibacter sp. H39-3-26]|uniref:cell division protein ZipA C-terminal FtsZ-binding domain-containing protein n=1 Tax=Curvibacter soli TaxID=3031331 RepID=UPI0023D9A3EE|nr:cell division protein ZipA C-terminal FtsZ-binding domain-containing protein [Ramlibacter sp. H39-3-26]MDF1484405.1 cell division protein ZipA C-terminal FtsZ-binding domain-containing protein [Ramlibacter sp. H39-3-26]
MSTLQISLAIAGGLGLAAMVAYNAWTSRRNAPKQADPDARDTVPLPHAHAPADGADPLAQRQEPAFDIGTAPGMADAGPEPLLRMPPPTERRGALDLLIDAIAPMQPEHVVAGEAALAALPPTRRAGSKPFAIEGLNAATRQWEQPAAGQRYTNFQAGVQLANRTGALNEIEYSEFVMKARAFADAIGAEPDFPDMLQVVARARELDQFAGDHDAQLAFVLRARQAAWSPGYIQQNAQRLGFLPGAIPGRMVLPAPAAGLSPVLSLAFDSQAAMSEDPAQTAVREVVLSLDVPQVPRGEQPFQRLREAAAALAGAMDGVVTDQNGQALSPQALDHIGAEVEQLYDKLDRHDLGAGSVLARRVFS